MSSHADTIRSMLPSRGTPKTVWFTATEIESAHQALDALLAEIERLREALDAADWLINNLRVLKEGGAVRGLSEASAGYESAREALAGDAE